MYESSANFYNFFFGNYMWRNVRSFEVDVLLPIQAWRYTRLRDFIHAHEKSVTFPPPIFMKLTTAQHFMCISLILNFIHIALYHVHVESTLRHSFKLQILRHSLYRFLLQVG